MNDEEQQLVQQMVRTNDPQYNEGNSDGRKRPHKQMCIDVLRQHQQEDALAKHMKIMKKFDKYDKK